MKKRSVFAILMALVMSLSLCLAACGQSAPQTGGAQLASGGVLVLSVNPEIAVEYDENGTVTAVIARNNDAIAIIDSCEGLIGQQTKQTITDLVAAIGDAGYFVEEIEGESRQIVIEIEPGSSLPHGTFLEDVIAGIQAYVSSKDWSAPVQVLNDTDYGLSDFLGTDYDSTTDYTDTDYGTNYDATSDYTDTDYGTNYDATSDYNVTDYGTNYDATSDYTDTDYGTDYDSTTDYADTDYEDTDYDDSDYDDSDYDDSDYDDSDYNG